MNAQTYSIAPRRAWLIVFALWTLAVAMSFVMVHGSLGQLNFNDPDDALRLMQVRDFLGGQSWFDVTQYRSNPPYGGPMHWSRLVDLPISVLILLFRPLVGAHMAEVIAVASVPALTLGGLYVVLFLSIRRLMGGRLAILTIALLSTALPILAQTSPLRIDHHAWQVVMIAIATGGLLMKDRRIGGIIAGLGMASGLHISSEGLPLAAWMGALFSLRFALEKAEWPRLIAYAAALCTGSAAFLLGTRGWQASLIPYCDAMSPVYLLPLAAVALTMLLCYSLLGDATPIRRLIVAGAAGVAGALTFLGNAGPCLKGPFETLDPLVYDFWYLNIKEGMPIWVQTPFVRALLLGSPVLGLAGYGLALHGETDKDRRKDWAMLTLMALGAFLVSLMVMRAMSAALLLALPGNAILFARLYKPIATMRLMPARVIATVSLAILTPTGLSVAAIALLDQKASSAKPATPILTADQIALLNTAPKGVILAPLDLGPMMLVHSHHTVVSTGHHRNAQVMSLVLHAFLASPQDARHYVLQTRADYVLVAPTLNESGNYEKRAPNGLGAQLLAGKVPPWLRRVPVPGMAMLTLYRVQK
jgi:hypothetical protein